MRVCTVAIMGNPPNIINVSDLNDHPGYKDAAVGALEMWSSVTPLEFEVVDDGEVLDREFGQHACLLVASPSGATVSARVAVVQGDGCGNRSRNR